MPRKIHRYRPLVVEIEIYLDVRISSISQIIFLAILSSHQNIKANPWKHFIGFLLGKVVLDWMYKFFSMITCVKEHSSGANAYASTHTRSPLPLWENLWVCQVLNGSLFGSICWVWQCVNSAQQQVQTDCVKTLACCEHCRLLKAVNLDQVILAQLAYECPWKNRSFHRSFLLLP